MPQLTLTTRAGAAIVLSLLAFLLAAYLFMREAIGWLGIVELAIIAAAVMALPALRPALVHLSERQPVLLRRLLPSVGLLVVLYAFSGWPFFWSGSALASLFQRVVLVAITLVFLLDSRRWKINIFNGCLFAFLVIVALSTALAEALEVRSRVYTSVSAYLFVLTAVTAMLSIDFAELRWAANRIIRLYLVISLPSILILLALATDVNLPYVLIELGGRGAIYRLYPFGIVSEETIFELGNGIQIARLNGFSDEPGVLGTYAVFFIILNRLVGEKASKRTTEFLLHVLGILSISLFYFVSAFILLLLKVYDLARNLGADVVHVAITARIKKVRLAANFFAAVLLLSVGATVAAFYVLVDPESRLYYLTIARFLPSEDGGIAGDSRAQYMQATLAYLRHVDWATLLIGNGPGSNSLPGGPNLSSWAASLYDEGLLGFFTALFLYCYIIARSAFVNGRFSLAAPVLLLPAFLSFYQRPETIGPIVLILWVVAFRTFVERDGASEVAR